MPLTEKNNETFPEIFVASKFPGLAEEILKTLPKKYKLINIDIADKTLRWDKGVRLEPEEIKAIQRAEVLVADGMIIAKMFHDLPKAKWIQMTWAGTEMIFEEFERTKLSPSYKLTRYVDEYYGDLMSNYIIGQIINVERCLYSLHDMQKDKRWARPYFPGSRVISELTIGVLGAGKLGNAVATLLLKAGATVLSFVKTIHSTHKCDKQKFVTDLNEIFEKCDYICNVLPSTAETCGLLDGDTLKKCKQKPVFINIGRGDIIKNDTIIKALSEEWISKAVLDVFETEPLPANSPLWTNPNVIITPHMGAIPRISGCAKYIVENYQRFVSGEDLINEIDWNKGY